MFKFTYPAKVEKDEAGFFLVTFPDIHFAATDGKTMAEALEEARDCLEEAIAVSIADNLNFPFPSPIRKGLHAIPLTARMAAKAALYIAVCETGISKSELARRLGLDEKEIRRMLSPRHQTKLPRIEQALSALGYQLSVSLQKAA
ncbi:MAG: type II toxin-antitoxin system HicB family antitoxin [Deltaproteobacteria bacterium]|nr:type II toxin-antitoxin system HicB family antitoxin [Deltaproteobacteria bacterium]